MLPTVKQPTYVVDHPSWYLVKTKYKQQKPYNLPLPYEFRERFVVRWTGTVYSSWTASSNAYDENLPEFSVPLTTSRNRAYAKFIKEFGETSSFGATLTAERRETFGMIMSGVMTIMRSARNARKGNLLGVMSDLGLKPPEKIVTRTLRVRGKRRRITERYLTMPDGRLVAKRSANAWLLWSYGISPLMSDVQNSTDVFVRDVHHELKIKVHARSPVGGTVTTRNSTDIKQYRTVNGSVRTGYSATVTVVNPNLWLANQLGLVNPAQWVNEAVPFSFVIDWASNWSQVISSLTDFAGVTLSDQCVSTKWLCELDLITNEKQLDSSWKLSTIKTTSCRYSRTVSAIPRPTLLFKYERFEWQRGLNAISLLIGFLPKGR